MRTDQKKYYGIIERLGHPENRKFRTIENVVLNYVVDFDKDYKELIKMMNKIFETNCYYVCGAQFNKITGNYSNCALYGFDKETHKMLSALTIYDEDRRYIGVNIEVLEEERYEKEDFEYLEQLLNEFKYSSMEYLKARKLFNSRHQHKRVKKHK